MSDPGPIVSTLFPSTVKDEDVLVTARDSAEDVAASWAATVKDLTVNPAGSQPNRFQKDATMGPLASKCGISLQRVNKETEVWRKREEENPRGLKTRFFGAINGSNPTKGDRSPTLPASYKTNSLSEPRDSHVDNPVESIYYTCKELSAAMAFASMVVAAQVGDTFHPIVRGIDGVKSIVGLIPTVLTSYKLIQQSKTRKQALKQTKEFIKKYNEFNKKIEIHRQQVEKDYEYNEKQIEELKDKIRKVEEMIEPKQNFDVEEKLENRETNENLIERHANKSKKSDVDGLEIDQEEDRTSDLSRLKKELSEYETAQTILADLMETLVAHKEGTERATDGTKLMEEFLEAQEESSKDAKNSTATGALGRLMMFAGNVAMLVVKAAPKIMGAGILAGSAFVTLSAAAMPVLWFYRRAAYHNIDTGIKQKARLKLLDNTIQELGQSPNVEARLLTKHAEAARRYQTFKLSLLTGATFILGMVYYVPFAFASAVNGSVAFGASVPVFLGGAATVLGGAIIPPIGIALTICFIAVCSVKMYNSYRENKQGSQLRAAVSGKDTERFRRLKGRAEKKSDNTFFVRRCLNEQVRPKLETLNRDFSNEKSVMQTAFFSAARQLMTNLNLHQDLVDKTIRDLATRHVEKNLSAEQTFEDLKTFLLQQARNEGNRGRYLMGAWGAALRTIDTIKNESLTGKALEEDSVTKALADHCGLADDITNEIFSRHLTATQVGIGLDAWVETRAKDVANSGEDGALHHRRTANRIQAQGALLVFQEKYDKYLQAAKRNDPEEQGQREELASLATQEARRALAAFGVDFEKTVSLIPDNWVKPQDLTPGKIDAQRTRRLDAMSRHLEMCAVRRAKKGYFLRVGEYADAINEAVRREVCDQVHSGHDGAGTPVLDRLNQTINISPKAYSHHVSPMVDWAVEQDDRPRPGESDKLLDRSEAVIWRRLHSAKHRLEAPDMTAGDFTDGQALDDNKVRVREELIGTVARRVVDDSLTTDARLMAADELSGIEREFSASVLLDLLQSKPMSEPAEEPLLIGREDLGFDGNGSDKDDSGIVGSGKQGDSALPLMPKESGARSVEMPNQSIEKKVENQSEASLTQQTQLSPQAAVLPGEHATLAVQRLMAYGMSYEAIKKCHTARTPDARSVAIASLCEAVGTLRKF